MTRGSAAADPTGKPPVSLGDKNFSEAFLIGDLYQQALTAKGYTVTLTANIGGSEVIDSAFKSGQVDLYPEYTGEIRSSIAGDQSHTQSAEETWQKAKAFEEANRDVDPAEVAKKLLAANGLT